MTILASYGVTVDASGISAPDFAAIYQSLQEAFKLIYGPDAYIEPDSQDGQWLASIASAINDCNNSSIAVFQSFSPTYAQGAGLSSVIKINGIQRLVNSFSTAIGTVTGVAGTQINNGSVKDLNGNIWDLPSSVTIPPGGSISVTVTSETPGAVAAPASTITKINTPTYGWQSFTNTAPAAVGQPVEVDATVRVRQTVSTSLPAQSPLGAMLGVLSNLPGVIRLKIYENDTDATDANTIPEHSICVVIAGGDIQQIVNAIGAKKTQGANTYGTTSAVYTDSVTGIPYTIHFYVLAQSNIKVVVNGTIKTGYTASVATDIKNSIASYINTLDIGQTVEFNRLWQPAYQNQNAESATYHLTSMTIQLPPAGAGTSDITIPFNSAAFCVAGTDITVNIS